MALFFSLYFFCFVRPLPEASPWRVGIFFCNNCIIAFATLNERKAVSARNVEQEESNRNENGNRIKMIFRGKKGPKRFYIRTRECLAVKGIVFPPQFTHFMPNSNAVATRWIDLRKKWNWAKKKEGVFKVFCGGEIYDFVDKLCWFNRAKNVHLPYAASFLQLAARH